MATGNKFKETISELMKAEITFKHSRRAATGLAMFVNGYRFQTYPFKSKGDLLECIKAWRDGMPYKELRQKWPLSKEKLNRLRGILGEKFHGNKGHMRRGKHLEGYEARNMEIKRTFKRGKNYSAIAKQFFLSRDRVRQIITDYKMPR